MLAAACGLLAAPAVPAQNSPPAKIPYPAWLFPIDEAQLLAFRNPPKTPVKLDDVELLSIPDSSQKYTLARINDKFNAPDWHPESHGPLPEVVAKGRKPKVIACGFCHTPTGQGRPENSALAGLPEAYIKEQLRDFRSGKRPPIGPEEYLPSRGMHEVALAMTDAEIDETAKFFAAQKLARRVWVVESVNIPRAEPSDWVYKEVGGSEELGDRLLEVAPDITRHQYRDDRMQYTAYVPPGSLARGKLLANTGDKGKTQICATCHLANLKGTDRIPPIAGARLPTCCASCWPSGTAHAPAKRRHRWRRASRNSSSMTWSRSRPTWDRCIPEASSRRYGHARITAAERQCQVVEQSARAALAAAAVLEAIEEGVLLGEHQLGALAGQHEFDAGQRHRDLLALPVHVVGINQALLGYHVEILRFEA
jgi:cytochrome c553